MSGTLDPRKNHDAQKTLDALFVALGGTGVVGATLPSAGGQMQQVPPSPARPESWTPNLPTRPEPVQIQQPWMPDPARASNTAFTLQRLQVTGATVFAEADLLQVAGFEPGREVSLPTLQVMAERITQHYRRHERLASVSLQDKRISYGCINVPTQFWHAVVLPAFRNRQGIVYVLPDSRPLDSVFAHLLGATEKAAAK